MPFGTVAAFDLAYARSHRRALARRTAAARRAALVRRCRRTLVLVAVV